MVPQISSGKQLGPKISTGTGTKNKFRYQKKSGTVTLKLMWSIGKLLFQWRHVRRPSCILRCGIVKKRPWKSGYPVTRIAILHICMKQSVIATALHSEIYLNICTVHKDHGSELTAEKYTELIFVTNNTFLLLANLSQEFY